MLCEGGYLMLSDREKFIYIATSIQHALMTNDLDKETQTRILIKMVEKFCPRIKYSEWRDIFYSVEDIKENLAVELIKCVESKDYEQIHAKFLKVFGYTQEEYEPRMKKLNIDIDKVKQVINK